MQNLGLKMAFEIFIVYDFSFFFYFLADTIIKHVFIICNKADNEWAEKCRSMLTHPPYRLNVATARQDFVGGKTVQSNYNALMASSNKILLVLTPDFLTNVWTPYLVSNIDTHLHRVVPIMIQKCDIPDELKDKVCIDNDSDDEFLFYKHLFNALQEEINTTGAGEQTKITLKITFYQT